MCGRMTVFEFDDVLGIARAIEYRTSLDVRPDQPAQKKDALPNDPVSLLVAGEGVARPSGDPDEEGSLDWNRTLIHALPDDASFDQRLEADVLVAESHIVAARKKWGFETQDRTQVVFNTRIETAEERPLWKDSIEQRRCIVPVRAFYETHATEKAVNPRTGRTVKQSYRFTSSEGPLLLAGIWKGDRFSIVTTEPNASVSAVHDRMPLVLSQEDAREWLLGDWRNVARTSDLSLDKQPLYTPQPTVEQPHLF